MTRVSAVDVLLSLPAVAWPAALVIVGLSAIDGVPWLAPALPENPRWRVAAGTGLLLVGLAAFSGGIAERLGFRRRIATLAWSIEVVCLWAGLLAFVLASFRS